MKKIIPLLLLFFGSELHAQKGIDGLIKAERDFANYAVNNNTKDAFLAFLDSNGIVFDNARPVRGMKVWASREKRPGILNWHPQFAGIAASGDFGYTTGPWTFQAKTITDTVIARGQYTTVWHMDNKGAWKFLVDMGVSNTPPDSTSNVKKMNTPVAKNVPLDTASFLQAEQDFINVYAKSPDIPYTLFLSREGILNRNKHSPAVTAEEKAIIIQQLPAHITFTISGYGMATSGDMGYVYGITTIEGKTGNYLHIWRKETDGWKLIVDVLPY